MQLLGSQNDMATIRLPVTVRSPTGMHGRKLASKAAERSLLRSPRTLLGVRASQLRSTSASSRGRSRRLESAFRSPARTTCRQAAPPGIFPAEFFDYLAGCASDPFDRRLPASPAFASRGGSLPMARCLTAYLQPDRFPVSRLPIGVTGPAGSPPRNGSASGSLP